MYVSFSPNSFIYKYSLQVIVLVQGLCYPKHHKHLTFAEIHLGCPGVAQNQGDLTARQGIWRHTHTSSRLPHISLLTILAALRLTRHDHCACSSPWWVLRLPPPWITAIFQVFIFDGKEVLLNLVLHGWLLPAHQQLVGRVDVGVDQRKVLNLGLNSS